MRFRMRSRAVRRATDTGERREDEEGEPDGGNVGNGGGGVLREV